jgi:NAD-dependent DNA ligase
LAKKLYAEIKNSEAAPFNTVLAAFSIPLIGKTASDKLSKIITNITEINESSCKQAGLGPKATENLLEWLHKDFFCFYDGYLPFDFKFETPLHKEELGVVCISGKLKSYKTKALATAALLDKGYIVKSSLTKDVTILVNESGVESAKTNQARKSGITIIENLLDLIGE